MRTTCAFAEGCVLLWAQLRAPTPPPPQPSQSDLLGSLDKAELGRLLAANQALVQQQVSNPSGSARWCTESMGGGLEHTSANPLAARASCSSASEAAISGFVLMILPHQQGSSGLSAFNLL